MQFKPFDLNCKTYMALSKGRENKNSAQIFSKCFQISPA